MCVYFCVMKREKKNVKHSICHICFFSVTFLSDLSRRLMGELVVFL